MSQSARICDQLLALFNAVEFGAQWFADGNGTGKKGTREPAWFKGIRDSVDMLAGSLDDAHDVSGHITWARENHGIVIQEAERWLRNEGK